MQVEAIQAVATGLTPPSATPVQHVGEEFWHVVQQGVISANQQLQQAHQLTQAVAANQPVPPEQLMLAIEQATLSLKLANQIKDRLVGAYQELFRMQV